VPLAVRTTAANVNDETQLPARKLAEAAGMRESFVSRVIHGD
jgi:hypothetical protein